KISRNVRITAINLYKHNLLNLEQILDCVSFSEWTFYHILQIWRETGDVVQHTHGAPGQPWLLHFNDVNYLLCLVNHWSDWFLDKLLGLLDNN
ncbi:hypothetical protein PAXRUDRAFT_97412, partial [Paxillus rubicundulus Ve08.2h10]